MVTNGRQAGKQEGLWFLDHTSPFLVLSNFHLLGWGTRLPRSPAPSSPALEAPASASRLHATQPQSVHHKGQLGGKLRTIRHPSTGNWAPENGHEEQQLKWAS